MYLWVSCNKKTKSYCRVSSVRADTFGRARMCCHVLYAGWWVIGIARCFDYVADVAPASCAPPIAIVSLLTCEFSNDISITFDRLTTVWMCSWWSHGWDWVRRWTATRICKCSNQSSCNKQETKRIFSSTLINPCAASRRHQRRNVG